MPQGYHHVEDAAQAPNITLLVVWLFLADLWRQIIWCSDRSLCAVVCVLKYSRDTEISYLYLVCLGHEYVLGFQVAMEDFPIVDVFDCEAHLHEPVKDLILTVHH